MIDSATGNRRSRASAGFWANGIRPHLAATPTERQASYSAGAVEQFSKRTKLLGGGANFDGAKFDDWLEATARNYLGDERIAAFSPINIEVVGLPKVVKDMNASVFGNANQRLPEAIKAIETVWAPTQAQIEKLNKSCRSGGPEVVGSSAMGAVGLIDKKVGGHKKGPMGVARTLRRWHKTLGEELGEEEVWPLSKR